MFIRENCKQCGACLSGCPIMRMPPERAKEEIHQMLETGQSSYIDKNCARCSYCNTICPTQSNPFDLREEIFIRKTREKGVRCLPLICKEISNNTMSIALEYEREEKERDLEKYENPPASEEVFYAGCSLTNLHPDILKTELLRDLPVVGGMKYCCGHYVHFLFGDDEARIKGAQLLQKFRNTGIKKIITFCPACDYMTRIIYPRLIDGFDIQVRSISEYLVEKYQKGEIHFPNSINNRIAFHDPCTWRDLDDGIYEAPRKLLEIMGAEVVEMKHNRKRSICCGVPLIAKNPALSEKMVEDRVAEAKESGAQVIAVGCTGCFALAQKAAEQNLELFNITELAQIAIGEKPPHRIIENQNQLVQDIIIKISETPAMTQDRYLIRNGDIQRL